MKHQTNLNQLKDDLADLYKEKQRILSHYNRKLPEMVLVHLIKLNRSIKNLSNEIYQQSNNLT